MKLTILQENLSKSVSLAARFASTRAQLPILGNILLKAKNSKLQVSSTNLEISVSSEVVAKIEEEGELSIPAKVLSEIIQNLPKDSIDLETNKEQLKIAATGFTSKVLGMNSADFPKVPGTIDKTKSLKIPQKDILNVLPRVLFAASSDETRPVITGVLFILEKDSFTVVATDGFRLSRKQLKVSSDKELRVIVPKGVLNELTRLSQGVEDVLLDIEQNEKQVVFGVDNAVLTSRIIEGEYPAFEKIIPTSSDIKVRVDKEELLRAVKLASVFARDASNISKIFVGSDFVKLVAESNSSGSQETKIDAKVEGEVKNDFWIAFNYHFLEDFIHSVSGEEVVMDFTTSTAAGVFGDSSDPTYLHLIMPVNIQG
jgi:DNA polymerase-3 subunit beta